MASILIVDDDESDLLLLQSILRDEHELHVARNGEEALKSYLHHDIDVVVTDIQMPRGDGIELITALRGLDPNVAIVAISGQKPHKLGIAQMAGADSILSKPLNPQMLREAVTHAIERAPEERPGA
jgi:CheY-like chemotaxis protein